MRSRNSRRWLRDRLIPAVLLLAVAYILQLLLMAPLFTVTRVDIAGDPAVPIDQLVALTGVRGHNIFTIQTVAARQRVAALPEYEHVTVSPILPNRIHVQVVPYVASAVWHSGGQNYLVTDTGLVIKLGTQAGLLRIDDERPLELAHGDQVDVRVLRGAARLQTLLEARKIKAGRFLMLPDDTIAVEGPSGWRALFGLRGDLVRSADVLAQVLQRSIAFTMLDLRSGASPYYR